MSEKEKPRLSRLTAIMTQLQSKKVITAQYLAERHSVSIRTIYRDIRTLELSGIPIVAEEGKGYSILEGYHLPPIIFTEEEANALITLEQMAIRNKDESLIKNSKSAVEKIKAILRFSQKGNADRLADRVYFGGNFGDEITSDNLMLIQSAIINFQVLNIDYISSKNKSSNRDIEPFAVYSINGNYLLIAFCKLRNEFRTFRLDFIESITPLNKNFKAHDMTIKDYFEKYIKDQN